MKVKSAAAAASGVKLTIYYSGLLLSKSPKTKHVCGGESTSGSPSAHWTHGTGPVQYQPLYTKTPISLKLSYWPAGPKLTFKPGAYGSTERDPLFNRRTNKAAKR
ncbi:hypothetical protein FQA47_006391 [Oryzias melastigma]|uniref:Uncharacterized protein n=1 Tax=Oryzias melastigma TaxID=30732 RepID=A0A834CB59_ORYME|nr:hypothetical protein FQA47_006391 [Oryzias melastigma]